MSLITCPECGCEVSSKAPYCPKCGVRIAGNVKRCPICNRFLLMGADECPQCHTHFIVEEKEVSHESDVEPEVEETGEEMNEATQPEETQPTEKKGKSNVPWVLLILAVVLVGAGWFFYWNRTAEQEAEAQKAFEMLKDCNEPQNFEDFIARYPKSIYIDDVRAQLKVLEAQEKTWTEAVNSKDVDKLQAFINEHPNSPRLHRALQLIDSLDWQKAKATKTAAAYAEYITNHDNGEYITEAYAAHAMATKIEKQIQDSIAAAEADSIAKLAN